MQVLVVILNFLLVINAIALIVAVLMQQGNTQGLGAIAGGAETFFGKNKGQTIEGKLAKYTKIGVATFVVLAVLMTTLSARVEKNANTVIPTVTAEDTAENGEEAVEEAAEETAEVAEETAEVAEEVVEETAEESTEAN